MQLTVITGPMFAGKTTRLLEIIPLSRATLLVKPAIDTRAQGLNTHDGRSIPAHAVQTMDELEALYQEHDRRIFPLAPAIGIDDAQFLSWLDQWVRMHRKALMYLIIAGLDLDYAGQPWEHMAALLAEADWVMKLYATCKVCGGCARMTQRLVDGKPAPLGPRIVVGGKEQYEPRCRRCWVSPEAAAQIKGVERGT